MNSQWIAVLVEVLGSDASKVERDAQAMSFVKLGGTSLGAMRLAAMAEERLELSVDVRALLGPKPLAEVVATSHQLKRPQHPDHATNGTSRKVSATQPPMLLAHELHNAFHQPYSAHI